MGSIEGAAPSHGRAALADRHMRRRPRSRRWTSAASPASRRADGRRRPRPRAHRRARAGSPRGPRAWARPSSDGAAARREQHHELLRRRGQASVPPLRRPLRDRRRLRRHRRVGEHRPLDRPPGPVQMPSEERGEDPPGRPARKLGADVAHDAHHHEAAIRARLALRVVVDVQHDAAAAGASPGPVAVRVRQAPPVRLDVEHALGDQRAALESRRARLDQAVFRLRRRGPMVGHGSLR